MTKRLCKAVAIDTIQHVMNILAGGESSENEKAILLNRLRKNMNQTTINDTHPAENLEALITWVSVPVPVKLTSTSHSAYEAARMQVKEMLLADPTFKRMLKGE